MLQSSLSAVLKYDLNKIIQNRKQNYDTLQTPFANFSGRSETRILDTSGTIYDLELNYIIHKVSFVAFLIIEGY